MTFGDPFGLALYDKAREHVEEAPKQYEPAPAEKKPPTMHEKTAGKYIKDELKLNPADFKKFQTLCNLSGNDWVSIALANKESDDGTVETLMERATVKEVPLNGQQLAETVREIFNA
jgi:hypothetical protein